MIKNATLFCITTLLCGTASFAQKPCTAPYQFTDVACQPGSSTIYASGISNEYGDGVYRYQSGSWQQLPGKNQVVDVDYVSSQNAPLLARSANGGVHLWVNNGWQTYSGFATDAAWNPADKQPYKIDKSDQGFYAYKGSNWVKQGYPAITAKALAFDKSGTIYILDNNNRPRYLSSANQWVIMGNRTATDLFTDGYNNVWILSNEAGGEGYKAYSWDGSKWATSSNTGKRMARGYSASEIYIVSNSNRLIKQAHSGPSTDLTGTKSTTTTGGGSTGGGTADPKSGVNYQDTNGDTKLHYAVRAANTTEIVSLLGQGANINLQNNRGEAPIFDAVKSTKTYILKLLLDKGAQINSLNKQRQTPLYKAVEIQDKPTVGMLLDHGADVNTGKPIIIAVQKGNMEIVQMLLDKYADAGPGLQAAAEANNTNMFRALTDKGARLTDNKPFETAVNKNNMDIAHLALKSGAKLDPAMDFVVAKNRRDLVVLVLDNGGSADKAATYAMKNNDSELVMMALSKQANVNNVVRWTIENKQDDVLTACLQNFNADATQALKIAVELKSFSAMNIALMNGAKPDEVIAAVAGAGDLAATNLLLTNGANANLGMSPAIKGNHADVVGALIGAGANATTPEFVQTAAAAGNVAMVEMLLNAGADVNAGMDAAVGGGHAPVVEMMLTRGADASPEGFISKASGAGNNDLVKILLQFGATADNGLLPALKNGKSSTARILIEAGVDASRSEYIATAAYNGDKEIVELLLNRGAKADDGMNQAITSGQAGIVDMLMQFGADPAKEEYVVTAVTQNRSVVLKKLVDAGAPVTHETSSGGNLLHIAAKNGHSPTVKALLDAGVDVNKQDNTKNAPLHLAMAHRNNVDLATVIISGGAQVNPINNAGDTPFMLAKGRQLKRYLKDNGGYKNKK